MVLVMFFFLFMNLVCQRSAQSDSGDLPAIRRLRMQLERDPNSVEILRELGLLYYQHNDNLSAQKYLVMAIEHSNFLDKPAVWNYVNALYFNNQGEEARVFIEEYYHTYSKDIDTVLLAGRMNLCTGQIQIAQERFEQALLIHSDQAIVYHQILLYYEEAMVYVEAKMFLTRAVKEFPHHVDIVFQAAILLFDQGHVEDALVLFERILELNSSRQEEASLMIGAAHQALGNLDLAKSLYKQIYDDKILDTSSPSYVSFLSNYGLLLKNSKHDAEVSMGLQLIHEALEINPMFETALINLAMHYRAIDDVDSAVIYLQRAAEVSSNSRQLEIDIAANTMDEVMLTWDRVLAQRREIIRSLTQLLAKGLPPQQHFHEQNILNLHFNIQYHAFNDKPMQELIYKVYEMNIKHLSRFSPRLLDGSSHRPHLESREAKSSVMRTEAKFSDKESRIKIGFISKSFGVFEPHGLLLDGVVKYLPRSLFKVYVLRILLEKETAGHMISPTLADFADELVDVPQAHSLAAEIVEKLQLDILVFADALCEQVNHFLMFSRYAPVQILFWGNPITSGSPQVDYFLSGDFMEHPFRSRLSPLSEPYSEQVILLPGQGIWYMDPHSAEFQKSIHIIENKTARVRDFSREEFDLDPNWFVYLCPQNLFKLHVFFDEVIGSILERSPEAHVVFTIPGRRKNLTEKFMNRLQEKLQGNFTRCHFVPRVSSEQFIRFLSIGDVLLHPFPFDGSRISADSITAGIPYVTLPTEYLKGRMGATFYRTMNIPELVAVDVSDYIDIAVRLSLNASFLQQMRELISDRSWLIFEDMEVPFAWSQFLLKTMSEKSLSWTEFLASCPDRDIPEETRRRDLRHRNQELFDLRRGLETWLLDGHGRAVLEEDVEGSAPPRIFRDWSQYLQRDDNKQSRSSSYTEGGVLALPIDAGVSISGSEPKRFLEDDTYQEQYQQFQREVLSGDRAVAYESGLRLLKTHPMNILLNYEMGVIQYLRRNFNGALSYCAASVEVLLAENKEDAQLYACLGAAATHLAVEDMAVFALKRAWELRAAPSHLLDSVLLVFPPTIVESSLLHALLRFERHLECTETASAIMSLPLLAEGGAHLLALSQVAWTRQGDLALLHEVEATMRLQGVLKLSNFSLLSEIQRLQLSFMHVLETAFACSQHLSEGTQARQDLESMLTFALLDSGSLYGRVN